MLYPIELQAHALNRGQIDCPRINTILPLFYRFARRLLEKKKTKAKEKEAPFGASLLTSRRLDRSVHGEERTGIVGAALEFAGLEVLANGGGRSGFFLDGNFFVALGSFARETDLTIGDVDAQNDDFDFIADFDDVFRIFNLMVGQFGDVKKTFEIVFEGDENAEVGNLRDLTDNAVAGVVLGRNTGDPRIFGHLLETERDAAILLIDAGDDAFDLFVLANDFARMSDLTNPAHVGNVEQTVDALFELDEGAVVGEVADGALDLRANGILLFDVLPRIVHGLLETEGDFLLILVDAKDDDVDFIAVVEHLIRMRDALGPAHFANVNETFDAFFKLDKRAVGHDVDDRAVNARSNGILLFDVDPRRIGQLLEAEGDLFLLVIDVQDDDFDLLIKGDDFARIGYATIAHVGNVKQTVDSAKIDKGAEIGDILDGTFATLPDFEFVEEQGLLGGAFFFDESATANDDVATSAVDLEDDATNRRVDELVDVGGTTNVDLAGGKEDVDAADIDEQTALNLLGDLTFDNVAFFDRFHHAVPGFDLRSLALAEDDHSAIHDVFGGHRVLGVFDEHLHSVANLGRFFVFFPFGDGDKAFALRADVDNDEFVFNTNDATVDDLIALRIDFLADELVNFAVGIVLFDKFFDAVV